MFSGCRSGWLNTCSNNEKCAELVFRYVSFFMTEKCCISKNHPKIMLFFGVRGSLGAVLGHLGPVFGRLGPVLSCASLGVSWAALEARSQFWMIVSSF